jgi:hypothetical protein
VSASLPRVAALALAMAAAAAAPAGDAVRAAARPAAAQPGDSARAFPGAEGWAAWTPGGRGGAIVRVTTLAADGPGSLRAALRTRGPRTVVFEVGGVVDLEGRTLEVKEPYLTVAGQTAPAPGITLIRGGLEIETHDVVVRHLRIRPGEAGRAKGSGWEVDGISVMGPDAHDVIVDHCSLGWATDENLTASGPRFGGADLEGWRRGTARRVTFSNNLVAEALSRSTHAKGEHSKGSLVHDNVTDVLFLGNLFASNVQRNPLFKGGATGAVVNNVVYNPGTTAVDYHLDADQWEGHPHATGRLALVGNVLRHGPDTRAGVALFLHPGEGDLLLHERDNLAFDRAGAPMAVVRTRPGDGGRLVAVAADSSWPPGLAAAPAAGTWERVLARAGARPWDRDEVDRRVVAGVRAGTGRVIDGEGEVGGYPRPAPTRRAFVPAEWDLDRMTPRGAGPR